MRENTNWESAWYSRRYSSTLLSQVHGGRRWTLLRPGALLASPGTRTVSRPTNCGDMRRQAKLIVFVASVILRMFFFKFRLCGPMRCFQKMFATMNPFCYATTLAESSSKLSLRFLIRFRISPRLLALSLSLPCTGECSPGGHCSAASVLYNNSVGLYDT